MKVRNQKILWHPYTQHGLHQEIYPVEKAKGAYLQLEDGSLILDAISSWWVNIHGHAHPVIVRAISEQASKLDHVIFAGFTHEPALKFAESLIEAAQIRRMQLNRVFYSDNGSTAVEVALKMAYQYHQNRGEMNRTKFIALYDSYHGDTLGAMAAGDPNGFHTTFKKILPSVDFVHANNLEELKKLIFHHPVDYAAFIFEPIVQGAAGMKMYNSEYLKAAVELCRENGILTIADEVFTGFYRTGKMFASEHANISPDLMCLSKGITGGILPLAVTLTTEKIFRAFEGTEVRRAFLHGHSYTANPIACAAAIASWHLLHQEECQARIKEITEITKTEVSRLRNHPKVSESRSIGTIGAIELKTNDTYFSSNLKTISEKAMNRKVLLRPLGNVIYSVPPYCITSTEIKKIYSVMEEIIDEL